jgi:hypothetical protein
LSDEKTLSEKIDELIFWTKFSALPTFRALLMDTLREDVDKIVYELSDGEKSTREIAYMISARGRRITHVTIANMWKKWSIMNLVMPAQREGRYKKVLSLKELGIEIPKLEIPEDIE